MSERLHLDSIANNCDHGRAVAGMHPVGGFSGIATGTWRGGEQGAKTALGLRMGSEISLDDSRGVLAHFRRSTRHVAESPAGHTVDGNAAGGRRRD